MKTKRRGRFLTWILSIVMVISFMPVTAFGAGAPEDVLFAVKFDGQTQYVTKAQWDAWMEDDDMEVTDTFTKATGNIVYANYERSGLAVADVYAELFNDFSLRNLDGYTVNINPVGMNNKAKMDAEPFFNNAKTYDLNGDALAEPEQSHPVVPIISEGEAGDNGTTVTGLYEVGSVNGKYWSRGIFACTTAENPAIVISKAGAENEKYSGGTGEIATPYLIGNAADLNEFAAAVNSGNDLDKAFRLKSNIDLDDAAWTPIGNETNSFEGSFDGDGKKISGLNVDVATGYAGLFGHVSGDIKNLKVYGSVNSTADGGDFVGGIAGKLSEDGTIVNCVTNVDVHAPQARNIGGVAGFVGNVDKYDGTYNAELSTTKIEGCKNYGDVYGHSKVGGIVGENAGTITKCANKGHVQTSFARKGGTGGIAGRNGNNDTKDPNAQGKEAGTISYCYNTGLINCSDPAGCSWLAGIAGFNNRLSAITNSYNVGEIGNEFAFYGGIAGNQEQENPDKYKAVYSLVGLNSDDKGDNGKVKTRAQMQGAKIVSLLNGGEEVFARDLNGTVNAGYPVFEGAAPSVAKLTDMDISGTVFTYSGRNIRPVVSVYSGKMVLARNVNANVKNGDVVVTYPEKSIGIGQYTITIKGRGDYTGTISKNFTVKPRGTKITKLYSKKRAFQVKWTAQKTRMDKARVDGYRIKYSRNANMSKAKISSVKKYSSTTKTIYKLKRGATYHVQIQTYMKVKGKTYYSNWSGVKKVRVR